MFASVVNIGCRLNQSEGDSLRQHLANQGYELVSGPLIPDPRNFELRTSNFERPPTPDLVIINTCCVTREAERSSLNRIRRAAALVPKPRVVVTGCLAELAPERLRRITGVNEVLGIAEKERMIAGLPGIPDRSRAFLKVQDGCPNHCAFCVVSTLRTIPYSKPPDQVRTEVLDLLTRGFCEIVLVGLNLGTYGRDVGTSLARLLNELSDIPGRYRLRLSSLEPDTLSEDLVNTIARLGQAGILCPHLHLPLQSGADHLLCAMNRHYTAGYFRDLVERVVRCIPDINLGTDVIAGFPGEDETSLAATRDLLETLPLGYLHVFSYSPRPGTAAAGLKETIGREVRKKEVARLRALGAAKSLAYRMRFASTVRTAVPIPRPTASSLRSVAVMTDNYISVRVPAPRPLTPDLDPRPLPALVNVRIDRVSEAETCGTLVGP